MAVCLASTARGYADALYYQGFETNTAGWNADPGGDNNGGITRVASGGGLLGLNADNGSYYGEVQNSTNAYMPGYGTGGFSSLNGNGITPPPYPGWSFSQSISVYVNVATPAPTDPNVAAFWIDMAPSSIVDDGVHCYPFACSDEHNFQLTYNGSSVSVSTDASGGSPVLSINTSGWYTFQNTYSKGTTPTSLVSTDMNIYNAAGDLVSSTAALGNSDGSTLLSDNLAGPGYIWLPVWQDGFSNDVLGIDNVRADAPEPASFAIFATALLGLVLGLQLTRYRRG